MRECEIYEPVFFDETEHVDVPFETPLKRHRFLNNIGLSTPVDILRLLQIHLIYALNWILVLELCTTD